MSGLFSQFSSSWTRAAASNSSVHGHGVGRRVPVPGEQPDGHEDADNAHHRPALHDPHPTQSSLQPVGVGLGVPVRGLQFAVLGSHLGREFALRFAQFLVFGDVREHGDDARRQFAIARLSAQQRGTDGQPPALAVGFGGDDLASGAPPAGHRVEHGLGELVEALPDQEGFGEGVAQRLVRNAENARGGVVERDHGAVEVHAHDAIVHVAQDAFVDERDVDRRRVVVARRAGWPR